MQEFISGTDVDNKYLVIAKNGNMRLGIKPELIQPISSGVIAIMLRIRAARTEQDENLTDGNVVTLQTKFENPADAFKDITFEGSSNKRASLVARLHVEGGTDTPDEVMAFATSYSPIPDEIMTKLVDGVKKNINPMLLCATDEEINAFIQQGFEPILNQIKAIAASAGAVHNVAKASVGVFGSQQEFLKSAADAAQEAASKYIGSDAAIPEDEMITEDDDQDSDENS